MEREEKRGELLVRTSGLAYDAQIMVMLVSAVVIGIFMVVFYKSFSQIDPWWHSDMEYFLYKNCLAICLVLVIGIAICIAVALKGFRYSKTYVEVYEDRVVGVTMPGASDGSVPAYFDVPYENVADARLEKARLVVIYTGSRRYEIYVRRNGQRAVSAIRTRMPQKKESSFFK